MAVSRVLIALSVIIVFLWHHTKLKSPAYNLLTFPVICDDVD